MSHHDPKLSEHLGEELKNFNLPWRKQTFDIPGYILGKKQNQTGKWFLKTLGTNYYSLLKGRRTYNSECWLVTFDYTNSYEVATILAFIEHFLQKSS